MLQALDGSAPLVSDPVECAVRTSPASTFKIPHALIALETGAVSDAMDPVRWDGSSQPFAVWERDHSLHSAIAWSVVWVFQRTAASIGRERMLQQLEKLRYADDVFDGELTEFWLNGDLVVSPEEQLRFLADFGRGGLNVRRAHREAVKAALVCRRADLRTRPGFRSSRSIGPGRSWCARRRETQPSLASASAGSWDTSSRSRGSMRS